MLTGTLTAVFNLMVISIVEGANVVDLPFVANHDRSFLSGECPMAETSTLNSPRSEGAIP